MADLDNPNVPSEKVEVPDCSLPDLEESPMETQTPKFLTRKSCDSTQEEPMITSVSQLKEDLVVAPLEPEPENEPAAEKRYPMRRRTKPKRLIEEV